MVEELWTADVETHLYDGRKKKKIATTTTTTRQSNLDKD